VPCALLHQALAASVPPRPKHLPWEAAALSLHGPIRMVSRLGGFLPASDRTAARALAACRRFPLQRPFRSEAPVLVEIFMHLFCGVDPQLLLDAPQLLEAEQRRRREEEAAARAAAEKKRRAARRGAAPNPRAAPVANTAHLPRLPALPALRPLAPRAAMPRQVAQAAPSRHPHSGAGASWHLLLCYARAASPSSPECPVPFSFWVTIFLSYHLNTRCIATSPQRHPHLARPPASPPPPTQAPSTCAATRSTAPPWCCATTPIAPNCPACPP
jgi:hypothetical protein